VGNAGLHPGGRGSPQKIPEAAGIEKAKGYIEGLGEDFGKEPGSEQNYPAK